MGSFCMLAVTGGQGQHPSGRELGLSLPSLPHDQPPFPLQGHLGPVNLRN